MGKTVWDSERGGFMEFRGGKPLVKAPILANAAEPVVSREQVVAAAESISSPPVFQFDSRTVRTAVEGDEVWFVAKDVFETLELAWKGSDSLAKIPEEWRVLRKFRTPLENQHGSQGAQEKDLICLNFKAVCKVAFRSNKPEADRFTNWAAEVIDTIRKTGRYEIPQQTAKPVPLPASAPLLPGLTIGEEDTLLKHLVENLLRGKMTFWDAANGVMRLKGILEKQGGQTLGIRPFEAALRERGLAVSKTDIARYTFATKRLRNRYEITSRYWKAQKM